jgi:signal transduction histidine kinase
MEEALRRARQLTRQIQIFSRRGLEEPEPVAIRDVVEKAVGLMATSLGGATLRCELNSDERVMANESQLHQVVFNLFRNAVQALGGRDGVVSVKLDTETDASGRARQRQWVCLTVSDTGAGIPADVMGRIFEPFFTTRGSAGGSGMGLAIVHGIVKGYGGRIRVHSKTGQGTVFQVRFPTAPQDREKMDPAPLATDRLPSREPS